MAITPTGQFHLDTLQLNRPALIANRQLRQRENRADVERQALLDELAKTQKQLLVLLARFSIHPEPETTERDERGGE